MAASSLLILIDDITLVLDDVALMAKVAAKKTAGVLGDDLALNAQQVAGIRAERELPVVWAVAKGSLTNKVILVPSALGISAFLPWAITPLLMAGGVYLCFEGFEKLAHSLAHRSDQDQGHRQALTRAVLDATVDMVAFERDKIKGAVRTDFILSAEIVTIALGTVASAPLMQQFVVLAGVSLVVTMGVYSLVATIVKLDDMGFYLSQKPAHNLMGRMRQTVGHSLLSAAPLMMRTLSVVGTVAMFMVGGGILWHGLPFAHEVSHALGQAVAQAPMMASANGAVAAQTLLEALCGIVAGALALAVFTSSQALWRLFKQT